MRLLQTNPGGVRLGKNGRAIKRNAKYGGLVCAGSIAFMKCVRIWKRTGLCGWRLTAVILTRPYSTICLITLSSLAEFVLMPNSTIFPLHLVKQGPAGRGFTVYWLPLRKRSA